MSAGATILAGGDLDGELLRPTVVEEPAADTHLACDEAFGPVCTLQAVRHPGRGGQPRERDPLRAPGRGLHVVARVGAEGGRGLEFGGVTINEAPTFRADQMPYGGVKDSGNTREGPAWAVREMTEERLVVVQLEGGRRRSRFASGERLQPLSWVLRPLSLS